MFTRRDFLKGTSLLALGGTVPEFLARTARAAEPGKDTVLVVVEMTGGNDGLNTVIPYADERYYKFRPTLGIKKAQLQKVNDSIGLHPRLAGLSNLLQKGKLAVVQGVGYPNPDRSHFESMDVWQLGDPRRIEKIGWLARAVGNMSANEAGVTGMQVGPGKLPLALSGASGIVSLGEPESFELSLTGSADRQKARRKLLGDLSGPAKSDDDIASFVQRRQLQTLQAAEKIRAALAAAQTAKGKDEAELERTSFRLNAPDGMMQKLATVTRLIRAGLGTRIFYVSIDGFDTHGDQAETHADLLGQLGDAVGAFFETQLGDDAKRVVLMTYSEFGRRVKENGSRGTDHGAASCMFVAGPAVKAGQVGAYPSLGDLDDGDLKFTLDFRRIYATILDQWLAVDSRRVLGGQFEHVELLAKR